MTHGWIIIDKPLNKSSAQVVARVRWLLGKPKIGHAGTLDPLATGILPLAINGATKTIPYVMDADKEYVFEVTWGTQTTTDDGEGEPLFTSPHRPTGDEIAAILPPFQGDISQKPPSFSAIKIGGQRAYHRARSGEDVIMSARIVTIHSLVLESHEGDTSTFRVHCGKGTYVRSLARDMGVLLGCYGYVSALRRTRVGKFHEGHAILLDNLEEMGHNIKSCLLPIRDALDDIPGIGVGEQGAFLLRRGQVVPHTPESKNQEPGTVVLCLNDTHAVALGKCQRDGIYPFRVFNES